MSQFVLFLVLGLSVGAVYAALTMGIVVTYQGTGVINFAAAAMATVPLYVYDELKHGKLGLAFLATAYLGGITSASGALVAGAIGTLGIVFVIFDRNLNLGKYYALFSGLSLILTVVLNPVGIAGKTRADWDERKARKLAACSTR
ncbi:MAG: hypothetical protein QM733_12890 [Ilumatobacteraceae bacterium]